MKPAMLVVWSGMVLLVACGAGGENAATGSSSGMGGSAVDAGADTREEPAVDAADDYVFPCVVLDGGTIDCTDAAALAD